MPFDIKNAPVLTFHRMVNKVIAEMEGSEAYIVDFALLVIVGRSISSC